MKKHSQISRFAMTSSSLETPQKTPQSWTQKAAAKAENIAFSARPGTKQFLDQYRADTGARSISEVLRALIHEKAVEYELANW